VADLQRSKRQNFYFFVSCVFAREDEKGKKVLEVGNIGLDLLTSDIYSPSVECIDSRKKRYVARLT